MNQPSNRKVRVTFKPVQVINPHGEAEAYTRPPFDTTEHNLDNVKRIHGKIYKEAVFIDALEKIDVANPTKVKIVEKVVEKIVIKEVKGEFTDEDMVIALSKKGKTNASISKTLDIPVATIEAILSK